MAAVALLGLLALLGGRAAPARAVQPEYSSLLTLGRAAYERRDFSIAVRNFRLACFGMLDEPKALADCLSRLALAQDKANDLEGFQQTFQRLIEVEEKFAAYTKGDLAADLRAALEPRLQARIPAATLEGSPGFRFLAPKKPDAVAAKGTAGIPKGAPKGEPKKESKPKAGDPAANAPAAPATPSSIGAEPPKPKSQVAASPKPLQDPPPAAAPVPAPPAPTAIVRPLSETERDVLQQAREKLAVEQPARELRALFDATKSVADAHPESKEAQHLVGQSAYRLSRWSEAVTYFKRGGDPGDDQSELLFYVAVSLFESGDTAGAAATLKRALPNLRRTDYVDKYAKKILGQ